MEERINKLLELLEEADNLAGGIDIELENEGLNNLPIFAVRVNIGDARDKVELLQELEGEV